MATNFETGYNGPKPDITTKETQENNLTLVEKNNGKKSETIDIDYEKEIDYGKEKEKAEETLSDLHKIKENQKRDKDANTTVKEVYNFVANETEKTILPIVEEDNKNADKNEPITKEDENKDKPRIPKINENPIKKPLENGSENTK